MKINYNNLKRLIKAAWSCQIAGISTDKEIITTEPRASFTIIQWIILFLAIFLNIFLENGFNIDFCGYTISALSFFASIFFTFIVTLQNSFKNIDFNEYQHDVNILKNKFGCKLINYYEKTTVLSLYLILLSTICIILLSCTLLFSSTLNQNIEPIRMITNICHTPLLFTLKATGIFVYRLLVLYFLLDIIFIAIDLTSSIFDFMILEYSEKYNDINK